MDKLEAALDVAGIGGDIALVAAPGGPGEVAEGLITIVEIAATGKALFDAAGGDMRNLNADALVYALKHDRLVVARAGRWVPLIGSVGSGYSLYDNFRDAVTITKTIKYK